METAHTTQSKPNEGQAGKEWRQATGEQKATGNPQAWWEQLAGTLQDDKEGVKGWYKLLSNPLTVIIGLFLLGYWLFTQKQGANAHIEKESEQLKKEMKRLKKKYKKLQKSIHSSTNNSGASNGFVVLD
ncbi:hypothetical protein SAMN05428988_6216 [Chitinophaga sp. YR573]|uniref:hypothetical protein n=1 Tax=Chitinophaga sp. YR573 TaxID=1881040 RepID=UPI0008AAF63E|nr:hypothetical protein [Chitinophaga sp. YR573]SEW46023.1 hypothetical protein SAMN05428988_6216 [Chitinophaga sp. YR573]